MSQGPVRRRASVLIVQQALVHIAEDAKVADRDRLSGIEGLKFGDMTDHEHIFRRLPPALRATSPLRPPDRPRPRCASTRFVLHCRDALSGESGSRKPRLFSLFPEIERFCGHPRALIDIMPLEISAEPAATSPRSDIVEANAMPIRRAGKARRAQRTIAKRRRSPDIVRRAQFRCAAFDPRQWRASEEGG